MAKERTPKASTVTIKLPRDFVAQIIDGLDVLIEQWEATAEYLESGYCDESICIRECSDSREARRLAEYYTKIRKLLRSQI